MFLKNLGRTIAVSCAYKADETISAPTALGISILRLFSALGTSPFVLHHSVNQVQIGYNTIERDFDWYNGFYWTIYDVYIKANRASMMGYLEKTKKGIPCLIPSGIVGNATYLILNHSFPMKTLNFSRVRSVMGR